MPAPLDLTETGMANGALAHIGEPPIASLDDAKRAAARYAKRFFASERDELLRTKDWEFARNSVTPIGVACLNKAWRFRYTMPVDCLAVVRIGDYQNSTDEPDWECPNSGDDGVQATILDTDAVAPLVYYTRRLVNPAQWDETFATAFKLRLAIKLNPLVGRDKTVTADLRAELKAVTFSAAQRDSQQRAGETISRTTSWITARWGFPNGRR